MTLTTQQVCAVLRRLEGEAVTPRKLCEWAHSGLVVPSAAWPRRRGRTNGRLYTLADVSRARLVLRLRRAGLSTAKVRTALDSVADYVMDILAGEQVSGLCLVVARDGHAVLQHGDVAWAYSDKFVRVALDDLHLTADDIGANV